MANKKHVDPLKAKQKRQKIIAAVLGVLFVGVLAFQVPRVMKMMKTPPNPHANDSVTTTTATGTPSLAAPTLRGAEQPATTDPTTGAPVAISATPTVQDGQLASFSRFASKDPFIQQLRDEKSLSPSTPSGSGGSTSGNAGTGGAGPTAQPNSSSPRPGSAVISVNGTLYTVATNSDFPESGPLFHLVSLMAHSAKISIVGGSYTSGSPAVTLSENKAVTLVNTADGTRYTIILKPRGTNVPGGLATPSTSGSSGNSGNSGSGTTSTNPTSTTVTLPSP
jgi:hypothetical protein